MSKKQIQILQTVFGYATGQIAAGRTTYVFHRSDKISARIVKDLKENALVKVEERNDLIHVTSAVS